MPAENLVSPYNAADWLLMPSRHENFGNVAVEAFACGCGIIASKNVGALQYIQSSPSVYTLERVAENWTNCLQNILQSRHVMDRPDASGLVRQFSAYQVADIAYSMYKEVLK